MPGPEYLLTSAGYWGTVSELCEGDAMHQLLPRPAVANWR
jgi:hypothetical protein